MANCFQTRSFKELEKIWNEKLIASGFDDIEKMKNGERILKQQASNSYRQASIRDRETRLRYYQLINEYVTKTNFSNLRDQVIMKCCAKGLSRVKISKYFASFGQPIHQKTVRFIIRRYEHQWNIRHWTLKQRNLKR